MVVDQVAVGAVAVENFVSTYDVLTPDGSVFLSVRRADDRYLVRTAVADFLVSGGARRVSVVRGDGVDVSSVEQLLVDQVLPRSLQVWGAPSLHASAVAFNDGVIALLGPSGAGKSTLCAACCEAGATMVSDDCVRVTIQGDQVLAWPGYPSVRLWPTALSLLPTIRRELPQASERTVKRRAAYPLADGPLPLVAVAVLAGKASEVQAAPLSKVAALRALSEQVHRLDPTHSAALRREFEMLSELVSRVPMYELAFPDGVEPMRAAVKALADLESRHSTSIRRRSTS